ncbi:MAG: sortase domain-bontaining protein [Eubacterium sp.]
MSDKKSRSKERNLGNVYISKILIFLAIALSVSITAIVLAMPKAVEFVHSVEAQFPRQSRDIAVSDTLVKADEAKYGERVAALYSDDFGLNCNVYCGSNRTSMRYGAGWFSESDSFGGNGVCMAVGYGETYFAPLYYAESGDIITAVIDGKELKYKVFDAKYIENGKQPYNENSGSMLVLCAKESLFSQHNGEGYYVFADCIDGEGN